MLAIPVDRDSSVALAIPVDRDSSVALAILVDRDSSVALGVWEAGGIGFFLRRCAENIFSQLRLACSMSGLWHHR